jgi:hypothetical protein
MTWAVEDRINLIIARLYTEISPFSPDLQYSTVPSNKKYQQGLRCLFTSCQARGNTYTSVSGVFHTTCH